MKRIAQWLMAVMAKKTIRKYNPIIIGITGSVGKTSAKEAVYLVVSEKYSTRKSEKNFNNEFGLPFTVLGISSPGRSLWLWAKAIMTSLILILFKRPYPEALVLEMGVDKPGDMDHLLGIAKPSISAITSIGISHYEFFKNQEAIEKEKRKIAEILTPADTLVVNKEDAVAYAQKDKTKAKVLSYGMGHGASISMENIQESLIGTLQTQFTVVTPTKTFDAWINAIGKTHMSAVACAVAVGEALNIEKDKLVNALSSYKPLPGRLNVLPAIKRGLVIDDTYNSAPYSTAAAMSMLSRLPGTQKIAVLGDMLELGEVSKDAHESVGKMVATIGIDKLITVGSRGKIIAETAKSLGYNPDHILSFDTADEAKKTVQEIMPPGSAVLVKGSQGMRMEKITKEIMAEPNRAEELLCRQYGKWLE